MDGGGPIHWNSKRQTITARSSTEAEIYAVDECIRSLQHISHIFHDIQLQHLLPPSFPIYNDNEATVKWSHNMTTKRLRHLQMRENVVRELIQSGFCTVQHIQGQYNLSDLFTKEDRDKLHFCTCRNYIMSDRYDVPMDIIGSSKRSFPFDYDKNIYDYICFHTILFLSCITRALAVYSALRGVAVPIS